MRTIRRSLSLVALAAWLAASTAIAAGGALPAESLEPFKLGTFEIGADGQDRVGIVLRDELVVELERANHDLQRNHGYVPIPVPQHMLGLIEQYEYGLRHRIYEIVNHLIGSGMLEANPPDYVHAVGDVRTLAPIRNPYPSKMLNAAVNYYEHISEGAPQEVREQQIAARQRDRGVPYLFHKTVRGAVIGNGDPIVIPYGREHADWEVELAVVMGRRAKYVPAPQADDYIFGYTVHIDVSDRAGRPPGGFQGVDWYVGKGRDSYAPLGPWIVPREFFPYPERDIHQRFVLHRDGLGGAIMQDSGTEDMIHSVAELIEYASSVSTLFPGDTIAAGSPSGVGSGTAVRGYEWYMREGDVAIAEIEGIGTLRHPVLAERERPEGTGSFLPPTPWDDAEVGTTPWETEPLLD